MGKRFVLFTFLMILVISACGSDDKGDSGTANRPEVRLKVGSQTFDGAEYSYCWPQKKGDVSCDLNETALESAAINIPAGSETRFVIEGDFGQPLRFTVTPLDGQSAAPADFGTATEGLYVTSLTTGVARVQVDAQYADVDGEAAYVSYIFALQPASEVAGLPTPMPTDSEIEPTAETLATDAPAPTASPTVQATVMPTAAPTESIPPRAEATGDQTNLRAAPDLESAVIGQIAPGTLYPILGESGEWYMIEYPGTAEGIAWVHGGLVQLTGEVTSIPMLKPDQVPTVDTSLMTEEASAAATAEVTDLTAESTEMPVATATPTKAQPSPTNTVAPTKMPDTPVGPSPTPTTAAPVASPTGIATVQPSAAGMSSSVPSFTLKFAGREYSPLGYEYCERQSTGELLCIQQPAASGTTQRITLQRSSAAQLQIGATRPTEVRIEYLSDTGLPTGQPETLRGDNTILFTIMPEAGTYIMSIRVTWIDQTATYFFRVAVNG